MLPEAGYAGTEECQAKTAGTHQKHKNANGKHCAGGDADAGTKCSREPTSGCQSRLSWWILMLNDHRLNWNGRRWWLHLRENEWLLAIRADSLSASKIRGRLDVVLAPWALNLDHLLVIPLGC